LAAQIALDRVFTVDHFAHAQHLVVGQLVDAPFGRDADLAADLERLGAADAVNVGEPDRNPLLIGDIDASYPRHLRLSFKHQNEG